MNTDDKTILVYVGVNGGGGLSLHYQKYDLTIGFEPIKELCEMVANNIPSTLKNRVIMVNCALSNKTGKERFYVATNGGASSSLAKWDQDGNVKIFKEIDVYVQELDKILEKAKINHIDNLIIDAQGSDFTILKTIEPMIRNRGVNNIQIECHIQHDVYEGLDNNFYKIKKFLESDYNLVHLEIDGTPFELSDINKYTECDAFWTLK